MKYIGITGIVTNNDVQTARECVAMMPTGWRLMAGVLVSAKTLAGLPPTRARYPWLCDVGRLVADLNLGGAWPVVHFNSRAEPKKLLEELQMVMFAAPEARGIQLNIVRPDLDTLRAFKAKYPHVHLILQLNKSSIGKTPTVEYILTYTKTYEEVASHALLDLSGGVGVPLNIELATAIEKAWTLKPELGVAGGLDAESVGALRGLSVSCDSETKLRTPDDMLDREKTLAYTRAAVSALCGEAAA